MNTQHTKKIRRVLAVILSLALLLTFTPLSGVVTLSAGAETASAYTFVKPSSVELTPNAEWTAIQFDMSELHLDMADGGRTAKHLRLVLGVTNNITTVLTNTKDNSKTIVYGLSNTINTNTVLSQRMLDWNTANTPQNMYLHISPSAWEGAEPGTYTGAIPYHFMWNYSTSPRWSSNFGSGSIPVTVTIPGPTYHVSVSAEPAEGGTVTGAGDYEEGTWVELTATPNYSYHFIGWQTDSSDMSGSDSFRMPDHAVELTAVFAKFIPPQYTYDPNTHELHLISGDLSNWITWDNINVPKYEVLSVTADKGVRFVGFCNYLFSYFTSCKSMDLSAVDTSQATEMSGLFYGCESLTSLDLSGWDTANVTNMSHMFDQCLSLTSLDLSGFDTSNVTHMDETFTFCKSLVLLDFSGWDTSNVTSMYGMFMHCESLVSLDLSGFDTARVENMAKMFYCCFKLLYLDLTGFDTSSVISMEEMFRECHHLTALDPSSFDTANVESMSGMFMDCQELKTLDISVFDTGRVNYTNGMFEYCKSLYSLTLPPNFAVNDWMHLPNQYGWIVENNEPGYDYNYAERISGDGENAVFDAPAQVTTFRWKDSIPGYPFRGRSLSLDGDIGLIFYINISSAGPGDTVEFEWYSKGGKKTASCTLTDDDLTEDYECYCATCPLTVSDLSCVVKATFVPTDWDPEDCEWDMYSAARFADRIKSNTDGHAHISAVDTFGLSCKPNKAKAFPGQQVKLYFRFDDCYAPDTIALTDSEGTNVQYTLSHENGDTVVTFTMPEQGVTVTETSKEWKYGDANLDGRLNILDVTAIQRHLAGVELLSGQSLAWADADGDGTVDIADATHLQKYLARYNVVLGNQNV